MACQSDATLEGVCVSSSHVTAGPVDVSVVICAYTEARWNALVDAVTSVQRQSVPPREIIVAVDYNDALLARVRSALAGVQAVANQEARGLSGARNSGLRAASGALIAFMDDDAIAEVDWLERLHAQFADQSIMGVGGAVLPLWQGGRPGWFPEEFDWVVGCTYRGLPQVAATVRNLIGANMCFRREVCESVGGFRSGIGRVGTKPLGCEETELCIRAHQLWPYRKFLYEPRAVVHHHVPEPRTRWSYFRSRCLAEGISKARVARLVGAGDGLASERTHALKTLPCGVARAVKDMIFRGDPSALARAGAIVVGLGITSAGYIAGTLREDGGTVQPPPTGRAAGCSLNE